MKLLQYIRSDQDKFLVMDQWDGLCGFNEPLFTIQDDYGRELQVKSYAVTQFIHSVPALYIRGYRDVNNLLPTQVETPDFGDLVVRALSFLSYVEVHTQGSVEYVSFQNKIYIKAQTDLVMDLDTPTIPMTVVECGPEHQAILVRNANRFRNQTNDCIMALSKGCSMKTIANIFFAEDQVSL